MCLKNPRNFDTDKKNHQYRHKDTLKSIKSIDLSIIACLSTLGTSRGTCMRKSREPKSKAYSEALIYHKSPANFVCMAVEISYLTAKQTTGNISKFKTLPSQMIVFNLSF